MHKTGNMLNALPKSIQPKAKSALHGVWPASTCGETGSITVVRIA
jgi:hypothetical protein